MKATTLKRAGFAIAAAAGLFAFTLIKSGSIKGTVSPAASATNALIISSSMDTIRAAIDNGSFMINDIKSGIYKLVIQAAPPYKNFEKEGIMVSDDKDTDLGQITLQQ
jgi:hypothetical protein